MIKNQSISIIKTMFINEIATDFFLFFIMIELYVYYFIYIKKKSIVIYLQACFFIRDSHLYIIIYLRSYLSADLPN